MRSNNHRSVSGAWRAALLVLAGTMLAHAAATAAAQPAAAVGPLASLPSLSEHRVAYMRHLASSGAAAGSLGGGNTHAATDAALLHPTARAAIWGRPRRLLNVADEADHPGTVTLLTLLLGDKDASLGDSEEQFWELPDPGSEDDLKAPVSSVGEQQQATSQTVVDQIAGHVDQLVPGASIKPPSFQQMDTTLRVADNRMARPTCVYPGALITAIIAPVYGQATYWAGCNSTISYSLVAAACLGQQSCAVRASSDVFGDPCPDAVKSLTFTYRCEVQGGEQQPSESPPPPSPSPPPNSPPPPPHPLPPLSLSPPPPSPPPPSPTTSISTPSPPVDPSDPTLTLETDPVPPRRSTPISPSPPLDLNFPPMAPPLMGPTLRQLHPGCIMPGSVMGQRWGVRGDGLTDDSAALQAADADGATSILYFPVGTYRISANVTLTKTVVMGAFTRFLLDPGATLTLTQQPKRAPTRNDAMFIGDGTVQFDGDGIEVYPEWWKSDARSASWALQAAINSCSLRWCTVLQTQTVFFTEGSINLHPRIRFFSTAKAHLQSMGGTGEGLTLLPGSYAHPLSFTLIYGFREFGLRVLPGVQHANVQVGIVGKNRQGLLLTARSGAGALRNVTFSHIAVNQDNQNSIVFNSADPEGSLFEDVTVRINFEVMGGMAHPNVPTAGVLFQGGNPTLRNTAVILQANDPAQFKQLSQFVGVTTTTPAPVANFVYRSECWNGGFEMPGQFLTGRFRDSFFYIATSIGHWPGEIVTLGPDSGNNVISTGTVASAAGYWRLNARYDFLRNFNSGKPLVEQGMYVAVQVGVNWPPMARRTFYLFSPFAQGVASDGQIACFPFRSWNPGLVCQNMRRAPTPGSPYQIAIDLVNRSTKTIPAGFQHRFGVQISP